MCEAPAGSNAAGGSHEGWRIFLKIEPIIIFVFWIAPDMVLRMLAEHRILQ